MRMRGLRDWRSEMGQHLSEIEREIASLQAQRSKIINQLGAMDILINGEMGNQDRVSHVENDDLTIQVGVSITNQDEAWHEFELMLRRLGWSLNKKPGRLQIYEVHKEKQFRTLWRKFSKYHDNPGSYWYGINPSQLKELGMKPGAVLLLTDSKRYVCFPFAQLSDLLLNGTVAGHGAVEFHLRWQGEELQIMPSGTGEWTDVSRFSNGNGLREAGLDS